MGGGDDLMAIKKGNKILALDLPAYLLDKIYPIGSIYMSVNNVSPASFLGGTWAVLQDRFLIGAGSIYEVNATGGASSHTHTTGGHTLTVSEIPSHTHGSAGKHSHSRGSMNITGKRRVWYGGADSNSSAGHRSAEYGGAFYGDATNNMPTSTNASNWYESPGTGFRFDASRKWEGNTSEHTGHTHSSVGGNGSHSHGNTGSTSNIPPYLAVYMWKRTE